MPKKSIKEAAIKGASVFNTIARGAEQAEDVEDVQNVQDKPQLERLNLRIPADIKAYLQEAAYRASSPAHTVSLTEYLCDLVRADMKKNMEQ